MPGAFFQAKVTGWWRASEHSGPTFAVRDDLLRQVIKEAHLVTRQLLVTDEALAQVSLDARFGEEVFWSSRKEISCLARITVSVRARDLHTTNSFLADLRAASRDSQVLEQRLLALQSMLARPGLGSLWFMSERPDASGGDAEIVKSTISEQVEAKLLLTKSQDEPDEIIDDPQVAVFKDFLARLSDPETREYMAGLIGNLSSILPPRDSAGPRGPSDAKATTNSAEAPIKVGVGRAKRVE
ncbi:hypothetical protein [Micromonospora saelicesensis]|uniref:hypothetical protein n=1 Tax=Micromonospora saelicesensis TaxID=285676 RepID=UPI0011BDDA2E|nr:hypothetical protein [Micromonospora saelicesensis]